MLFNFEYSDGCFEDNLRRMFVSVLRSPYSAFQRRWPGSKQPNLQCVFNLRLYLGSWTLNISTTSRDEISRKIDAGKSSRLMRSQPVNPWQSFWPKFEEWDKGEREKEERRKRNKIPCRAELFAGLSCRKLLVGLSCSLAQISRGERDFSLTPELFLFLLEDKAVPN